MGVPPFVPPLLGCLSFTLVDAGGRRARTWSVSSLTDTLKQVRSNRDVLVWLEDRGDVKIIIIKFIN